MVISGIIRPPPEIRAAADKTASFVASKGRVFEARIRNSAQGKSPRFAFLHESSPFHAYYEDRIKFYEEGGTDEKKEDETKKKSIDNDNADAKKDEKEDETKQDRQEQSDGKNDASNDSNRVASMKNITTQSFKASALDPVARALLKQRQSISSQREASNNDTNNESEAPNLMICQTVPASTDIQTNNDANDESNKVNGITAPPMYPFVSLSAPSNCTPVQLEIMKLVAQFTALQSCSSPNKSMSPELSFLKELTRREWNNPMLGFVQPRHASFAYFTALVDGYKQIIQQSKRQHKGQSSSKFQYEQTTSECLEIAAYRAEFDRDVRDQLLQKNSNDSDNYLSGSALLDWHDFVVVETIDFAAEEVVAMLPPPPPPSTTPSLQVENSTTKQLDALKHSNVNDDNDDDMQESSDDEDMEGDKEDIQIDPTYQPRVVSSHANMQNQSRTHVLDPISGKSIPLDQMSEHLRIQLLDPKWAEEKKKFQDKQKESNLGGDIARNINNFVGKKRDSETMMMGGRAAGPSTGAGTAGVAEQQVAHVQPPALVPPTMGIMPGMIPPGMPPAINVSAVPLPPLPPTNILSVGDANATTPMPPHLSMLPPIMPGIYPPPLPPGVPTPTFIPGTNGDAISLDASGVPIAKKPRLDDPSTNEEATPLPPSPPSPSPPKEFPNIIQIQIRVPTSSTTKPSWNLNGQTVSLPSIPSSTSIKQIKEKLEQSLGGGMPLNKMQLKDDERGVFLKDVTLLKDCGVSVREHEGGAGDDGDDEDLVIFDLVPKVRGGRK